MQSFIEWMSLKLEARKKPDPHPLKSISSGRYSYRLTQDVSQTVSKSKRKKKPKKIKPIPTISIDIDRWMKSLDLLSKDIEEYKKIKKRHDEKVEAIAKKQKEQERLAASVKKLEVKKPEVKKPEVKKPEVKKPEVKKPEVKKPEVKKSEVKKPVKKKKQKTVKKSRKPKRKVG